MYGASYSRVSPRPSQREGCWVRLINSWTSTILSSYYFKYYSFTLFLNDLAQMCPWRFLVVELLCHCQRPPPSVYILLRTTIAVLQSFQLFLNFWDHTTKMFNSILLHIKFTMWLQKGSKLRPCTIFYKKNYWLFHFAKFYHKVLLVRHQ